ncbi:MAG TPA: hypothetical protein P5080_02895 [Candidatus Paceibacterota bacterium]|nr:hypothetical protein [Candidatus Pacearchaeota archaeon]HRZ50915.1 hypothetical protein [Candidatus Paceibacterota bacterium]HSA36636.1 hypothetical protein [Candidatus Paceibacterota bacterium]
MRYKINLLPVFLFGFLVTSGSIALATSVNRMALVNLEGFPGKTVKAEIILEGNDQGERTGFWYTHYKKMEGDSDRMDISSWITILPKEYTIKQGETKVFSVELKVPDEAEPGLWGATSEEAAKEGHSGERRTYIVFKDAAGEGNVYSGLLIPISVIVAPNPNLLASAMNFAARNATTIALLIVIMILLAILFFKQRKGSGKLRF